MPVPIGKGKKLLRQFIPAMDPNYGYIYRLSEEECQERGGLLWYNESKQFYQMRAIYMTGPGSHAFYIKSNTLVVEIGSIAADIGGNKYVALGVWFGPNSGYNDSHLLDMQQPGSTSYGGVVGGVLYALTIALISIREAIEANQEIDNIKIQINNAWLVGCLAWHRDLEETCHYYYQHHPRDYHNLSDLAETAHSGLETLEALGRTIEFWLVDDMDVSDATDLAERVLKDEFGTAYKPNRQHETSIVPRRRR